MDNKSPTKTQEQHEPQRPTEQDRLSHLKEDFKLLSLKLTQTEEYNQDYIRRLYLEVEYYKEMFLKQKEQFEVEKRLWERNS
jgi:hypothetical protein